MHRKVEHIRDLRTKGSLQLSQGILEHAPLFLCGFTEGTVFVGSLQAIQDAGGHHGGGLPWGARCFGLLRCRFLCCRCLCFWRGCFFAGKGLGSDRQLWVFIRDNHCQLGRTGNRGVDEPGDIGIAISGSVQVVFQHHRNIVGTALRLVRGQDIGIGYGGKGTVFDLLVLSPRAAVPCFVCSACRLMPSSNNVLELLLVVRSHHRHLVCFTCESILDGEIESIKRHGFIVMGTYLNFSAT